MSKRVRRLVSEVLSFLLVFSLIPTPALAEIVSEATGQDDVASGIVVSDDMTVTDNGDGTYTISSAAEDEGEAEAAVPETTEATEEVVQTEAAPAVEADDEPVAVAATPSDEPSGDVTDDEPVAEEAPVEDVAADGAVSEEDAVASVTINGETTYVETLKDAFEIANGHTATISMLATSDGYEIEDKEGQFVIEGGSDITLDISSADAQQLYDRVGAFVINTGAKLTVTSSNADAPGELLPVAMENEAGASRPTFDVRGGTLNIAGYIHIADISELGVTVVKVSDGGTLNMSGGDIYEGSTQNGTLPILNEGGTVIISGGSIETDADIAIRQTSGTLNITGGSIKANGYKNDSGKPAVLDIAENSVISISGGSFDPELTVESIGITTNGDQKVYSYSDTAEFTVNVPASLGDVTYQWQANKGDAGDGSWVNSGLSGNKTATLSVGATKDRVENGYTFRCVVTDANGNTYVTDPQGFMLAEVEAFTVSGPENVLVAKLGDIAEFTVSVDGGEGNSYTYQWYADKNDGSEPVKSNMPGSTTPTLQVETTEGRLNYSYYCVVSSGVGAGAASVQSAKAGFALGSVTVTDSDGKVTVFKTLADAISAAQSGSTVTLLEDVSQEWVELSGGADLTIDLAGHTLTGDFDIGACLV